MEQLTKYYVIEASVFALQLNEKNQAAIIQTISDAVKAQEIVDLNIELLKPTDKVYTIEFRQASSSVVNTLKEGQYFVKSSKGYTVMSSDEFEATYTSDPKASGVFLDKGAVLRV